MSPALCCSAMASSSGASSSARPAGCRPGAISGAAPLTLVGILPPGPKLAALTGNRLLYRDGLPVALLAGGEVQFIETLEPASEWQAPIALLRAALPAQLGAPG